MNKEEMWREVEGFPDYRISSFGRVMHVNRPETARKVTLNHRGFPTLTLFNKEHPGSRYLRQVNKLVAEAYLGPPPPRMESVWHKDGDLTNCRADNLKWDMRARVLEWNEMHREDAVRIRTPKVLENKTGRIFKDAFECGLAVGEIESAIISHIERYPDQYADRARYRYID